MLLITFLNNPLRGIEQNEVSVILMETHLIFGSKELLWNVLFGDLGRVGDGPELGVAHLLD